MRAAYLATLIAVALVAGSTWASAQRFSDNPPGAAFQTRGIIEMNGGDPFRYGHRFYGPRPAYAWAYFRHHRFHHHYWR